MIRTPKQGNVIPPGVDWCADNGCFGKGWPGEQPWLDWLDRHTDEQRTRCTFATAPDVVGDAQATLLRSAPWLPRIRDMGFPAALVGQDGLTSQTTPWDTFDVLFIGGTTGWKLGEQARDLAGEAREREKHVHMGRVNSLRRLTYARDIGCHSADGTFVTFGPDVNAPKVDRWLTQLETQPYLTGV